ncbi:MAG: signal peptide peptidase SppA [Ahrensia sp.]|nr:signal peptide peptidase SppA [Ahrensia sp.]|tara:strand:+ start:20953 stop:21906 length:954 start_codon:yes stop_codon:yes gene_type:complete
MSEHLADDIIDRRRLRRKLTFWRVAAVFVLLVGLFAIAFVSVSSDEFGAKSRPHVAKIRIGGTIGMDENLIDMLDKAGETDAVKGVILSINSPGGTTTGGEAIYDAVRKLADKKPVAAEVETLAASAAYMIAAATDHIVARKTSIVGSIGVLIQYPNFAELLDNVGIDVQTIKSTPLKAEPGMFDTPPPGAEAMMRRMILDSYAWFKDLVQERRGLTDTEIAAVADGSVFTGRQAVKNKLIDAVGGEEAAREWLAGKGVSEELKVVEWKKEEPTAGLLSSVAVARWLGVDLSQNTALEALQQRLFLDGLISVWHGAG